MHRRLGASEHNILAVQTNLATTYEALGRPEALQVKRDVYYGYSKLRGDEYEHTLVAANNYASYLNSLERFEEAKPLLLKIIPVARRVLGDNDENTIRMRWNYATALYHDTGATLDDLREAVETLEDTARVARRVFGGAHPFVAGIERCLQNARAREAALRIHETLSPGGSA